jgi:transcriptional regulator GlxA family with amidase domain
MAPLHFGILCVPFQVTDVSGPMDVLECCSKKLLQECQPLCGFSDEAASNGVEVEYHHIGPSLEPIPLTGGFRALPTTTFEDCPKLDYIIVGGPDIRQVATMHPGYFKFLRDRAEEVKAIFTTCTGAGILGATGLLDGKKATINHQFLPVAQKIAPNVEWTKEQQWVIDGKFWTAGGACAGIDMFAHWVTENYGRDTAEAGFSLLDLEPRDINGKLVPLKYGLRV